MYVGWRQNSNMCGASQFVKINIIATTTIHAERSFSGPVFLAPDAYVLVLVCCIFYVVYVSQAARFAYSLDVPGPVHLLSVHR